MVDYITKALDYFNYIFAAYLTKFIGAVIILLIGVVIGRILGKLSKKALHEFEFDTFVRKTTFIKISFEELISHLIEYAIYFASIVYALSKIGLVGTVFQFISLIIIVFVTVSVILGLKDFMPNILAGMRMQQRGYFKEGDHIIVKGKDSDIGGRIVGLNLLEVIVETKNKDIVHIPNSLISKSIVEKMKSKK